MSETNKKGRAAKAFPARSSGSPSKRLTAKMRAFATKYVELGSVLEAERAVGLAANYGHQLLKHPRVKAYIDKLEPKTIEQTAKLIAKKRILNEDFLDEHLARVIRSGNHERRGFADVVGAVALAYKKERFLPEPAKTGIFNQVNAGVQLPPPPYVSARVERVRQSLLTTGEPDELASGD